MEDTMCNNLSSYLITTRCYWIHCTNRDKMSIKPPKQLQIVDIVNLLKRINCDVEKLFGWATHVCTLFTVEMNIGRLFETELWIFIN
jgi:hypothetical protein